MMDIRLDFILSPTIAADRGLELIRERTHHGVRVILYRELNIRTGDTYYVTVSHVVSTITSLERVAQYALLHS